jgi:hypothetical protein
MTKRKAKIIRDKKVRGEWAESVFLARAKEHGLPVSRPWGDSDSFDCVVGRPGKFAAVQVKSTVAKVESGKGYICSTCSSHKAYEAGAFDFLAAYVIPEDAWYIIPLKEVRGKRSISLCTEGGEAKYEKYREAWELLREAAEVRDGAGNAGEGLPAVKPEAGVDQNHSAQNPVSENPSPKRFPTSALERLEAAGNFFRNQLERGGVRLGKPDDEG